MHTPYTTAFRLLGEKIFEFMLLDEELAWAVFDFFTRQYKNLWQHICGKMGWHGINIHFGDCAATMLSPDLYEKYSLKIYQDYMLEYQGCTIHSCGPSSHLLYLFAQVPNVKTLQLGDGTDLKKTRCLFPDSMIQAYYSPVELLINTPAEIERKLWNMAEKLEDNFDIHVSSADPDTPEDNIQAYMKTALEIQR
jgi:uroporphyrinogen-III decarboxylase